MQLAVYVNNTLPLASVFYCKFLGHLCSEFMLLQINQVKMSKKYDHTCNSVKYYRVWDWTI